MSDETASPGAALPEPARKGSAKAKAMTRAAARHAVPFLLWIGAMLVGRLMHLTTDSGTDETPSLDLLTPAGLYAVQTALALGALLLLRPWRHYDAFLRRRNVLPALAAGVGVFALWVLPGSDFFRGLWPAGSDFWETYCVWKFGSARDLAAASAETAARYAPASTGWPLFAVHMVGTGVAIAFAEEFFWRGYLLRAARTPDFLDVPVGAFHAASFFAVAAVFAAEHAEIAAGFAAGLAYGWLFLRTRDIGAACLAHAATNALLGFYVLATGHWEFW